MKSPKDIARRDNVASEFVRYIVVGVTNTLLTVAFMLGVSALGIHYVIYTSIAYFLGFVNSFVLNNVFTFRRGKVDIRKFPVFLSVNLIILLIAQLVQIITIEGVGTGELVGVGFGMGTYTVCGFLANRRLLRAQV